MEMRSRGVRFLEDGREWRLPGLLCADELALCGEPEEDLRTMVEWFAEVCRIGELKVSAGKTKVMVLSGEGGLDCKVHLDGIRLGMSRNLNILGVFWTNQVHMGQSVVGKWQVGGGLHVPSGPWLMVGICR